MTPLYTAGHLKIPLGVTVMHLPRDWDTRELFLGHLAVFTAVNPYENIS
jgi:hypothetical protein